MTPTQHERLERIRAQASPELRAEIDLLVDSLVHGREVASRREQPMTKEEQERLRQIRERVVAKYQNVPSGVSMMECPGCGCAAFAATRDDIDFLLSLLDSQAAERDALRNSASLVAFQAHEIDKQIAESLITHAATRMRDRCVWEVREYLTDCRHEETGIIEAIAFHLESLTLDQAQEK